MGINQSSSCHAGSSCAVIPTSYSLSLAGAYTGSMKDGSVMEPCAAAKVLLLDGRVLHFTSKVRVSHVLAGFRHHCLCPLDSANLSSSNDSITTFFKPVSMHPDDLLRPPCVYILLPRRTFRLFAAAAAAAATGSDGSGSRILHRNSGSKVCDSGAYACTCPATGSKACSSISPNACKSGASSTIGATNSSRLCNTSRCPSISAHGASEVCDINVAPNTTVCSTFPTSQRISKNRTKRIPLEPHHIHATSHTDSASIFGSTTESNSRRRSFDLRHASSSQQRRPLGMRRCKSWRPGLQAINEVHVYS